MTRASYTTTLYVCALVLRCEYENNEIIRSNKKNAHRRRSAFFFMIVVFIRLFFSCRMERVLETFPGLNVFYGGREHYITSPSGLRAAVSVSYPSLNTPNPRFRSDLPGARCCAWRRIHCHHFCRQAFLPPVSFASSSARSFFVEVNLAFLQRGAKRCMKMYQYSKI